MRYKHDFRRAGSVFNFGSKSNFESTDYRDYTAGKLEAAAKKFLLIHFPEIKNMPSSISGQYHGEGETALEHIKKVASVARHICDALVIHGRVRDAILAACYLHDMGKYPYMKKGRVEDKGWKYYSSTGWSRVMGSYDNHPNESAFIIDRSDLPHKSTLKRLVRAHMSKWGAPTNPTPERLDEKIVALADYLATRKEPLFSYWGER